MPLHHRILRAYRWARDTIRWRKFDADLGEELDRSKERYGPVVHLGDPTSRFPEHEFEHDGIDVSIGYVDNAAAMVWHTSERAFSADFRKACFDAYSNDHDWVERSDKPQFVTGLFAYRPSLPQNKYWERADGKAWAAIAQTGAGLDDLSFHMDFTCGKWQQVKKVRYGVWFLESEKRTEKRGGYQPPTRPEST